VNEIVIFFLPVGVTRQDLESALRECLKPARIDKASPQVTNKQKEVCDAEDPPFWTWFLPNPRP
jgi:hypothetical protein